MKELFGVPRADEFRIHYYGPFSFDLRNRLASMEADEIVRVRPRGMGVTYEIGERFSQLRTRFSTDIQAASRAIEFTADRLGSLGVKKLEPLTTALYVALEMPEASTQERADRLRQIKQHIAEPEAIQAVEMIVRWQSELAHS